MRIISTIELIKYLGGSCLSIFQLTPQVFNTIKRSFLPIYHNRIHILPTCYGHCQVIPLLTGPAQIREPALDSRKVSL
jgi:hypothetical protein